MGWNNPSNPLYFRPFIGCFFAAHFAAGFRAHLVGYVAGGTDLPEAGYPARGLPSPAEARRINSATSHDLAPKGSWGRGSPLISGKFRLMKYYRLARWVVKLSIPIGKGEFPASYLSLLALKWDRFSWGNQTKQAANVWVNFEEYPWKNSALLGLVSYNDPCKTLSFLSTSF